MDDGCPAIIVARLSLIMAQPLWHSDSKNYSKINGQGVVVTARKTEVLKRSVGLV
jgi:hypothetical protein